MTKVIAIVVQSDSVDVYVNIISHCAHNGIHEIYFVGEMRDPAEEWQLMTLVGQIGSRLAELSRHHKEYIQPYEIMPKAGLAKDRVIGTSFDRPQDMISTLKKKFPDLGELFIDITCCSKLVAGGILSSCFARGVDHVVYFELIDEVYKPTWKESGKSRLYHDLTDDPPYYKYVDFSLPGPTLESFDYLRKQGKLIKVLLVMIVVLGAATFALINGQQTGFAQAFSVIIATISVLGLGLGFITDSLSLLQQFRK